MKNVYLKYISALLIFGSNGIVARYISLNSYEIVLFRTFIGSIFLLLIFIISKQSISVKQNKKEFAYIVISGLAMGASWMFLYEAYTQIGVSVATLAYYCGPIFVMALSRFVFKERIAGIKSLGFLSVLAGMYMVNQRELLRGGLSWGLLCGIMAAVMYAVMVIFNKQATSLTGLENSMLQLSFSFVAVAVFTLIKQGFVFAIPPQSILPILVLGVVNTGIGCYLYFSSIPRLPAQTVAICGYLEPVSALIFSSIFLQERLTVIQLFGTVFILGGAALGELHKTRKN